MLGVEQLAFVLVRAACVRGRRDGDDGGVVGCLVEPPEFAEFAVGVEALQGGGEFDEREGEPEVFADGGGDGLFTEEGELFEGGVVLEGGVSWGDEGLEEGGRKGEGTFKERVRE